MTPAQLRGALEALRWSQRALADALDCDDRLVRRWASGGARLPPEVASWLRTLAEAHTAHPPPESWRARRQPIAEGADPSAE